MNFKIRKTNRKITLIQVHCTASREGVWQTVDDIWEIQKNRKDSKFKKIAYHYIIYLDGSIHEGRNIDETPAGVIGYNKGAIAVVYVGGTITNPQKPQDLNGLAKDTRTKEQKESLLNLLTELVKLYPEATIHGHYEYANKPCPCFNAHEEYKHLTGDTSVVKGPDALTGNFSSYGNIGSEQTVNSNTNVERNPCPPTTNIFETNASGNETPMQPAEKFSGNTKEICKKCYNYFRQNGCSDACAKGILANIYAESGFNYSVLGWDGSKKGGHFGIGGGLIGFYYNGWLKDLAKYFNKTSEVDNLNTQVKNCGLPYPTTPASATNLKYIASKGFVFPFSFEQQLEFLVKKCIKSEIKTMTDPREAARWWINNIENPAYKPDRWAKNGNTILKMLE